MDELYKHDFEFFLARTDEKAVLIQEISSDIKKYNVQSLLDIGAGNGLLSIPISKKVQTYLAVEPNENFVRNLKEAGLQVIHAGFPLPIPGEYDMVLLSHIISHKQESFEPFLKESWKLVKQDGVLLTITFRGQEDDWTMLLKEIGEDLGDHHRKSFNAMIEFFNNLGEVKTRKVVSHIYAKNTADMIQALSFVYSNAIPAKKEKFLLKSQKIEKMLNSKYKTDSGYAFPFKHFFIYNFKK